MKKKVLALAMAAGLVFTAGASTASAQVTMKDGSTVAGWADTTVADLLPDGASLDDISVYTLTLTYASELTGEENFQLVVQNTVDWAWNQVSVGASTEALDYQGNPYNYAYVKVDANTVSVNIQNEGALKLMTTSDKLAVGDWSDAVVTNVTMTVNNPVEATSETPADDTPSEAPADDTTSEAPADDTTTTLPNTGLVSGAAFLAVGAAMMLGGAVVAKKKEN